MSDNLGIYGKTFALERLDRKLADAPVDPASKRQLQDFKRFLFVSGLGKFRVCKYVYLSLRLQGMIKKPLKRATKSDIMRVVEEIERSDYKPWTKHSYKLVLKKLYKWLYTGKVDGNGYPELVDWIPLSMRNGNHRLPEEILSQEEIKRMVESASNLRDKAFISALYESGCRVGEFLGLKNKHVQFDDYGAILIVDGKTGMRRVRVVASAPALGLWRDNHPDKGNQEAALWVNLSTNHKGKDLDYRGACFMMTRLAERVGISKKVNPHSFRHARATHLASSLTEAQMKELFGWVQASKMAAVYVHLSGRDVDHALLELYGIKPPENQSQAKNLVRICPRCAEHNTWDAKFCKRCALVLDLEEARKIERAEDTLTKLLNDPNTRKLLVERLYQLNTHDKKQVEISF